QNCVATNEHAAREAYVRELSEWENPREALEHLLLHSTTGLMRSLTPQGDAPVEIKLVSAVTLEQLLGPFDVVDYVESDIQQSEAIIFPPWMELLRRKVRRILIFTHGGGVHESLRNLFYRNGWIIELCYQPEADHDSVLGRFRTNDGILTLK